MLGAESWVIGTEKHQDGNKHYHVLAKHKKQWQTIVSILLQLSHNLTYITETTNLRLWGCSPQYSTSQTHQTRLMAGLQLRHKRWRYYW